MSTRRGGMPPPPVVAGDPGPWSIVSALRGAQATQVLGGGRRRPAPPAGLLIAPAPTGLPLPLVGLGEGVAAGGGPIRLIAAAREPALALSFDEGGQTLRGVSPYVLREWSVPVLQPAPERRPSEDPSLGVPAPIEPSALAGDLPEATASPDGTVTAVAVRYGGGLALALLRDGGVARWIVGARAAAWTDDSGTIAIGGDWGILLAVTA